ncbi:CRISPR system precrRNA processing endoribonuclease RAMP protein Cas6 [Pseudomonas sp. AN-1]|uniref:CRISPR system precrRNA processing endoribonuclease RAMP protein Cas6 n=1 Tax=Pseudomonas sp. AN-1 TaxID=3096605 RepID=UPI002A6B62FF|nr:CRISPR system precrRNA processing endoribonuclease RAMP protein Cas6 [Pseudomonas sp. AN-1]WPP46922.1 CRISPR system precrRNA processing endoribonuclease RAMP protein Cas6 [Pseudomonas sp. AN-1]
MPPVALPVPIERWSLRLQLARPLQPLEHCGSMLRGAFGHALKALACRCPAPAHRPDCLCRQIFEPLPPSDWPLRYRDCPPAYVITPPPAAADNRQQLDFAFTLLGPTLEQRALIWQAWQQAASQGLGKAQVPARLQALGHEHCLPCAPGSTTVHLQLTSPLLFKRKLPGQPHSQPLRPHELGIDDLLVALHRRLELTHRLYGVPATPLPALDEWLALGSSLRFAARLHEHHYARHSNRQQQRMPLYGLSGEIQLGGPLPQSLRDALALGQWLHIGGKTALGLGGYRLMAAHESTVNDGKPMP